MFSRLVLSFLVGILALLPSVGPAATGAKTLVGERKAVGAGTAYSWVRLDASGHPAAIGVTLSDDAVKTPPDEESETPLALPQVDGLPFKTVVVNYHPHGHPPQFYQLPHFDFHFYVIDEATRMRIAGSPAGTKPDARLVPAGFVTDGEVVPMMGMHYVPSTAPELHGKTFTQTPIYGYANGSLAFVEPMITRAFLLSDEAADPKLPLPATFERSGFYPTSYAVNHDAAHDEYSIALGGMTKH
jgi:hypothetical protein